MMFKETEWAVPDTCQFKDHIGKSIWLHESIFTPFKTACVYGHCDNWCCSHGAWITPDRVEKILEHKEGIAKYMQSGLSVEEVIKGPFKRSDLGYSNIDVFDTKIVRLQNRSSNHGPPEKSGCGYLTRLGDGEEGCGIHKYALDNSIDPFVLKPIGCSLFPLGFSFIKSGDSYSIKILRRKWGIPCMKDASEGPTLIESKASDLRRVMGWPEEVNTAFILYWAEHHGIQRELNLWKTSNCDKEHTKSVEVTFS